MNFKNILCAGLLCFGVSAALTGCSKDDDPFVTVKGSDAPRILNTDIPEGTGGEPGTLMSVDRTQNFTYEVIVTPVETTQVEWIIDGKSAAEGLTIDIPLLAGEHTVQIVAKTSGGEASRTCKVVVRPLDGDPVPANKQKERLVKPGTKVTLQGKNMDKVTKVTIGSKSIDCKYDNGGFVEYTVPSDLAEGEYALTVTGSDGTVYGAGFITLSQNPVYTVEENVLWEGEFSVTWGTPFEVLKDESLKLVDNGTIKAGSIIRAYVEGNGQGCVTSAWWNNILTGKGDPERNDIMISGSQVLTFELTELSISLIKEQNGMLIVGDGYTLKKVTVE